MFSHFPVFVFVAFYLLALVFACISIDSCRSSFFFLV